MEIKESEYTRNVGFGKLPIVDRVGIFKTRNILYYIDQPVGINKEGDRIILTPLQAQNLARKIDYQIKRDTTKYGKLKSRREE